MILLIVLKQVHGIFIIEKKSFLRVFIVYELENLYTTLVSGSIQVTMSLLLNNYLPLPESSGLGIYGGE